MLHPKPHKLSAVQRVRLRPPIVPQPRPLHVRCRSSYFSSDAHNLLRMPATGRQGGREGGFPFSLAYSWALDTRGLHITLLYPAYLDNFPTVDVEHQDSFLSRHPARRMKQLPVPGRSLFLRGDRDRQVRLSVYSMTMQIYFCEISSNLRTSFCK